METDIMTIDEVSNYLKLKLKTAYHLAAKGDIPGFNSKDIHEFKLHKRLESFRADNVKADALI